ncbi:MAG: HU family DNA-binding protein [Anaerolineae bacterium]|nr:HU family DNA-binding protein [Anaerolineae bacterium]
MNKTELVKRIARESKATHSPLTQAQVRQVLDALFVALTEELSQSGGRVEIEHFGVLESRVISNSPHGKLIGQDGIIRQPSTERFIVIFRAAKTLRHKLRS